MERALVERALALYGPLVLAVVGWCVRGFVPSAAKAVSSWEVLTAWLKPRLSERSSRVARIPIHAQRARMNGAPDAVVLRSVFAAGLLGVLWCLPALVLLQRVNAVAGWWEIGRAHV